MQEFMYIDSLEMKIVFLVSLMVVMRIQLLFCRIFSAFILFETNGLRMCHSFCIEVHSQRLRAYWRGKKVTTCWMSTACKCSQRTLTCEAQGVCFYDFYVAKRSAFICQVPQTIKNRLKDNSVFTSKVV